MTALDGYELVTVLDAPHELKALLYRRTPPHQQPAEPPTIADEPPPWEQDELPTALTDQAQQALAHLSPAQRSALGL